MTKHPDRISVEDPAVYLPLAWVRRMDPEEAVAQARNWLLMIGAHSTMRTVTFHLQVGGYLGSRAGFIVRSFTRPRAATEARYLRDFTSIVWPAIGLREPEDWEEREEDRAVVDVVEVEGPGRPPWSSGRPPWALAARDSSRTHLLVELLGPARRFDGDAVRCRVRIEGPDSGLAYRCSQAAAEISGQVRLDVEPRRPRVTEGPELVLPVDMVAQLISLPARMGKAFSSSQLPEVAEIVQMFWEVEQPHAAIFGREVKSKHVLFESFLYASMTFRRPAVVLSTFGDLAERAVAVGAQFEDWIDAVDFGDPGYPPRWNLCTPPKGLERGAWIRELVETFRRIWWDRPDRYFSPLWKWAMTVGLGVVMELASQPGSEVPLTGLASILSPADAPDWEPIIRATGDRRLLADWCEVHRAIEAEEGAVLRSWIETELAPFLFGGAITRIFGGEGHSDFDLDTVDTERTLVLSVPSAELGSRGVTMVSGLLLEELWRRFRRRDPDSSWIDLFVDDAAAVPSPVLETILAEGTRYRVRLWLAAATLGSLEPPLGEAVLRDCGVVGTFACDLEGAARLSSRFPRSSPEDLVRLEEGVAALGMGYWQETVGFLEEVALVGEEHTLSEVHRRDRPKRTDLPGRASRRGPARDRIPRAVTNQSVESSTRHEAS